MNRRLALISIFLLLPPWALGQQGDKPGAKQPPPPDWLRLPPSPPLSPEEALRAFKVPPGFRVELVAAEPLVEALVAMAFDPDGRIYVVVSFATASVNSAPGACDGLLQRVQHHIIKD